MAKLRKFFSNKYAMAGAVFAEWLAVWGLVFLTGDVLESLLLFILFYNVIYPVFTLVVSFVFAKKNGVVWALPVAMSVVAILFYSLTELVKFAIPNAIVLTIICVVFGTGVGNVMNK